MVNVGGDSNRNKDSDRVITELATAGPGPTSPSAGWRLGEGPGPDPSCCPQLGAVSVLYSELPRCRWPAMECQCGAVPRAVAGDETAQLSVSLAVCSQRKASDVTVPECVSWTWGHSPGEQLRLPS